MRNIHTLPTLAEKKLYSIPLLKEIFYLAGNRHYIDSLIEVFEKEQDEQVLANMLDEFERLVSQEIIAQRYDIDQNPKKVPNIMMENMIKKMNSILSLFGKNIITFHTIPLNELIAKVKALAIELGGSDATDRQVEALREVHQEMASVGVPSFSDYSIKAA